MSYCLHVAFAWAETLKYLVCSDTAFPTKSADALAVYGFRRSSGSQVLGDDVPQFIEASLIHNLAELDE